MYAVTGASGRLRRLVLDALLKKIAPDQIVALTRDTTRLAKLAERGVIVRPFDFDRKETLVPALNGVERLLLISGFEIGQRARQHRAAIQAAKDAGVTFIAYTSVLHADTCPIGLATEHRATEADIKASGLKYALLRHGWYTENTTGVRARRWLETFELARDNGYTLGEYAAALSEISGNRVSYLNMAETEYREVLERDGMPRRIASLLAEASAKCAESVMFNEARALSKLIGRPTTPLHTSGVQALSRLQSQNADVFQHGQE